MKPCHSAHTRRAKRFCFGKIPPSSERWEFPKTEEKARDPQSLLKHQNYRTWRGLALVGVAATPLNRGNKIFNQI